MTMPTGKLAWGQPGVYDAVDDRLVITALSGGHTGVVLPPALTAASGLSVQLAGGWLAIARAADGTNCVVGTTDATQFPVAAGGSATRMDYLWCDIEPELATWSLALIDYAQIAGRTGILLAQISVPAGANLSTQLGFFPAGTTFGPRTYMLAPATDFITVTGRQPAGAWTTVLSVPAGEVARPVDYFMDLQLFGDINNTENIGVAIMYPGNPARIALTVQSSWSASGARAGDATVFWHPDPTDPWIATGPIPGTSVWKIRMRGQVRTPAMTLQGSQQNLTVQMNARTGTNPRVYKGSTLSLTPAIGQA